MLSAKRVAILGMITFTAACHRLPVGSPIVPGRALLYEAYQAPLQADFDDTILGPKYGESSTFYFNVIVVSWILGIPVDFAWGDASVEAAAREGAILRVTHVDYSVLTVLGMFGRITMRAYGE
jgi:hypothetical protein